MQYEDVLVVRVHKLVPKEVWKGRYELINDFEKNLFENGTHILKFFLHISPEEQLLRFRQRLDDPARHWKISENDYAERELWDDYISAYEEAISKTSKRHALVHYPGEQQMVPESCRCEHRRGEARVARHEVPRADG